jgi:hypothetical protein
MVTSHKMTEKKMGYRGSKSNCKFKNKSIQNKNYSFVKEQRVDGSCFINKKKFMKLRYTLQGGASYYQTKIPSKQFVIQIKNFSSCFCARAVALLRNSAAAKVLIHKKFVKT